MRKALAVIGIAGAMFLPGCSPEPVYEQYMEVPGSEWHQGKEFHFVFDITDTGIPYDITFQIRNTNRYPYQNLWLFVLEEKPVGDISQDTVEYFLADDYGKWLGKGISVYESSLPVRSNYRFPHEGRYAFVIRHGMRDTTLTGVQEIGMIVRPCAQPSARRLSE